MYPYRSFAINPVWQSLAVIDFFVALAAITGATKRLGVPDKARAALDNWFNMIQSKFLEKEFDITFKAMEIIEFAEVIPFSIGIGAACLGFASAADIIIFPLILPTLFGLSILPMVLLVLFGLPILPLVLLVLFGLLILPLVLLALFGLSIFPLILPLILPTLFGLPILPLRLPMVLLVLFGLPILPLRLPTLFGLFILPLTYFTLRLKPIFYRFISVKFPCRFDFSAFATRLKHFVASLLEFSYLNYTAAKGET